MVCSQLILLMSNLSQLVLSGCLCLLLLETSCGTWDGQGRAALAHGHYKSRGWFLQHLVAQVSWVVFTVCHGVYPECWRFLRFLFSPTNGYVPLHLLPCPHVPPECPCPETSSIAWSPAPATPHQSRAEGGLFPALERCWRSTGLLPSHLSRTLFGACLGNCVPTLASPLMPLETGGLFFFLHSCLC